MARHASARSSARSKTRAASIGPGAPSGWNWTDAIRPLACTQPLDRAVVEVAVADAIAGGRQRRAVDDLDLVVVGADVDAARRRPPARRGCRRGGRPPADAWRRPPPGPAAGGPGRCRGSAGRPRSPPAPGRARSRSGAPSAPGRPDRARGRRGPGRAPGRPPAVASGGERGDLDAARRQRGQQRALDAVVDERRASAARALRRDDVRLARGHDRATWSTASQATLARRASDGVVGGRRRRRHDHRPARRAVAQARGSGRECRCRSIAGMPPSASSSSSAMPGPGGGVDQAGHDERARVDPRRLELVARDPVVAGHRVGKDHDLSGVGRIGQDLAPAGGGGGEDELALGRPDGCRADAPATMVPPSRASRPGTTKATPAARWRLASRCGAIWCAAVCIDAPSRHHRAGLKGLGGSLAHGPRG